MCGVVVDSVIRRVTGHRLMCCVAVESVIGRVTGHRLMCVALLLSQSTVQWSVLSHFHPLKKDMLTVSSTDLQGTVINKGRGIALRELTAPKSKMEIISMATCLLEVSKVLGEGSKALR